MSKSTTRIATNTFRVLDINDFFDITSKTVVRDDNDLTTYIRSNSRNEVEFRANDEILGFNIGTDDDPEYSFDAFVRALQTVIPAGECVEIHAITHGDGGIDDQIELITNKKWEHHDIHDDLYARIRQLKTKSFRTPTYLVDCGVLVPTDEDYVEPYKTYDNQYGYYDEDQYYTFDLNTAISDAKSIVKKGCDGSYVVISESGFGFSNDSESEVNEEPIRSESYDAKSVVYSIAKINNTIIENFVNTAGVADIESLRNDIVQYCLDNGTGIIYEESTNGFHNLTTEREKQTRPFGTVRYVQPESIGGLLSPAIISKTCYFLELRKLKHIEDTTILDLDQWLAVCDITGRSDMTYKDARTIIDILWKYDVDPLDIAAKCTKG